MGRAGLVRRSARVSTRFAHVYSVSCVSANFCVAGGQYMDTSGKYQGFVAVMMMSQSTLSITSGTSASALNKITLRTSGGSGTIAPVFSAKGRGCSLHGDELKGVGCRQLRGDGDQPFQWGRRVSDLSGESSLLARVTTSASGARHAPDSYSPISRARHDGGFGSWSSELHGQRRVLRGVQEFSQRDEIDTLCRSGP